MTQADPTTLFHRWTSRESLGAAWRRVRANKGCAGIDGIGVTAFGAQAEDHLEVLSRQLRRSRYRPQRPLRFARAKPSGGTRVLSVPCIRDRVAQSACASALDAVLDPLMAPDSNAFRKGRSVEGAIGRVMTLRLQGWTWALHGDVEHCFDRIPHGRLLDMLAAEVACPETLRVLRLWLRGFGRCGRGLAQGAPVSPLLCNWYLTPFDREMNRGRTRLVRYADDFVVLTRSAGDAVLARQRSGTALAELGLRLNEAKTWEGSISNGLEFLGHRFEGAAVYGGRRTP